VTPTLASALAAMAPGYSAREHNRAAERMVTDMEKLKLSWTYKNGPSPCDVSLVVRGPKQASHPGIDYPQNYVIIPESSLESGNEWTIYAICQNPRAAALFASAPDLLAACEEVVRHYEEMSGNPNFPVADKFWIKGAIMARAAIAKAKGVGK
jgi:hypothetical protein